MNRLEEISIFSSAVVLVFSAYSYFVSQLYVPSFGLGNTGYVIVIAGAAASMLLTYINAKKQSRGLAELALSINLPIFLLMLSPQSYTSGSIETIITGIVTLLALFASSLAPLAHVQVGTKKMAAIFVIFLVVSVFFQTSYVIPSVNTVKGSAPILDENWWEALNWIKNNTQSCSVVATYWDPGHFIRAIANRAVIFDGATQNSVRTVNTTGHEDGLQIVPYDNGINHIVFYKNGTATTSRINDVAVSLMTSNESLAVGLLNNYRSQNCGMYFLATSDLVGKSVWWTYFSTWSPTASKGTPYNYQIMGLQNVRPLVNQNAAVYTYPVGQDTAFLLIGTNDTYKAYVQQGTQAPVTVQNLLYYKQSGELTGYTDPNAAIQGEVLVEPDKSIAIYMPPQIENSMFTRLFLFNGAGLQHYQFVKDWGGEVKLFKISF